MAGHVAASQKSVTAGLKRWSEVYLIPVNRIIPGKRNSNRMPKESFEKLVKAIKRKFKEPLVVGPVAAPEGSQHKWNFQLENGEHRWKAAIAAGMTEVPCIIESNVSPDNLEIEGLRMNRLRGEIDLSIAAELIAEKAKDGWPKEDLSDVGFSPKEVDLLLERVNKEVSTIDIAQISVESEDEEQKQKTYELVLKFFSVAERDAGRVLLLKFAAQTNQPRSLGSGLTKLGESIN